MKSTILGPVKPDIVKNGMTLTSNNSGASDTTDYMSVFNDFRYDNETVGPLIQREMVILDKDFNTNVPYEKLKDITTQILAHPKALKNITTATDLMNNVNINLACKVDEDTLEHILSIWKTHKDALKQTHVRKRK